MRAALGIVGALALSCHGAGKLPAGAPPTLARYHAHTADTTFVVADAMLAAVEMQLTGEPFAQLLGRNIRGYNRFSTVPDLYVDPRTGQTVVDALGYASAVETYEYSKQPMNNLSFESGAGLALEYGPVLNPANVSGDAAFTLLLTRLQALAQAANAGGPPGLAFVVVPAPTSNRFNVYGWPGYWPQFAELRAFKPEIAPAAGATRNCSFGGGYAATGMGVQVVGDYECGYTTLNLSPRDEKVDKVLEPAALGFAAWKQSLWAINYWQSAHDVLENGVTVIADADLPQVGKPGNTVVGQYPDPNDVTGKRMLTGMPGTYLGDNALEGWQGLTMLEELHNKAALLLGRLSSDDGVQLGGFATTRAAIDYDYAAPLRWWPSAVAVTEVGALPSDGSAVRDFPQPTAFQIASASSRLRDLSALLAGFATYFALTDGNNAGVGGQPGERATFDGDPFPGDDGLPDGEDSPHDRALAILKVAAVDLDRLHFDAANHVLVDETTVSGGVPRRGTTVSTRDAAYAIVGLRVALRSLGSALTLYSNDTPDTHGGASALDGAKLDGAPAPLPARMLQLLTAEADFLADRLVAADGAVANGYDLAAGQRDASPTTLEAEGAALRGLLDAYLATSVDRYRQRAESVYADLERRFWMAGARAFRTTAGVDDPLRYSPLGFAALEGGLRQYWKLVARRPGNERVAAELLERLKRLHKLVLNGWDDANGDDTVQYPDECAGAGLQMAERALTGELSHPSDQGDRDHDCVKEIAAAGLPSALAAQVVFTLK